MFFNQTSIEVWRKMPASGAWCEDPEYALVGEVYGTIQPFTGSDSTQASQVFENVRDLITFDDYETDIRKEDELFYYGENHRVAYRQVWNSEILPHLEVYTTDTQWSR